MTTTPAIIAARNLTRRLARDNVAILDGVDFDLFAGERLGLVGPSGSGKSSLFRVLMKLDPLDSGEVLYRGQSPTPNQIPLLRRQFIYVPQRPSFTPGTVRENLLVPLSFVHSANSASALDYVSWLQAAGKSSSFLEQTVDSLSGGEQQIVSLLRAVQLEPEVLLLDEPTASLDAAATTAIERLVDAWLEASPGRAYAWTSHDAEQIKRRCDRIVRLESGRVTVPGRDASSLLGESTR